jgi:hypothetical protein
LDLPQNQLDYARCPALPFATRLLRRKDSDPSMAR